MSYRLEDIVPLPIGSPAWRRWVGLIEPDYSVEEHAMPAPKPAGLDEAIKPFKALIHAWGLQGIDTSGNGISDKSLLRNALPMPAGPTVGDVCTLVRVLESLYGEFPL